jgi:undecaprenyl-phosphate 4-deoxy-4-formamido-L-arabinose transferase
MGSIRDVSLPALSVVVPVYRAQDTLRELHRRLTAVLSEGSEPYEIILVDDRSDDASWSVIEDLVAQDPRVRGFRLGRNFGQHSALLCGIRAASYPVTITLDDDCQNPPEEIPTLLAALDDDHDVVYGAPKEEQHGFLRDQASLLTKVALRNLMGAETARYVSAFRALRTDLRDAFADYSNPFVSIDVLLTYGTSRFTHVVVRQDARSAGTSNYTVRKLAAHATNMITGFTTLPLRFASLAGLAFSAFGGLVLLYVLFNFAINGGVVQGFAFLASAVAIFAGVQLFALGIIGEYLGRMHERTMGRPPYRVSEQASGVPAPVERPDPPVAPAPSEAGVRSLQH